MNLFIQPKDSKRKATADNFFFNLKKLNVKNWMFFSISSKEKSSDMCPAYLIRLILIPPQNMLDYLHQHMDLGCQVPKKQKGAKFGI